MSEFTIQKASRPKMEFEVKGGRNSFKKRHGKTDTKVHRTWISMKHRCLPTRSHHQDYFDRGIRVCDRWHNSFEAFLQDMGEPPTPWHEIDRINNDGNYEPGNCRWVLRPDNQSNRRCSKWVVINGERKTAKEAAEIIGVHYQTLIYRLRTKWKPDALVSTAHTFHALRDDNRREQ